MARGKLFSGYKKVRDLHGPPPTDRAIKENKQFDLNRRRSKALYRRFKEYDLGAKSRGLTFDLTLEQFETFWNKPCSYCGSAILTIGLDRIDNKVGYILDNLVSCCWPCNRLKGGFNRDEFIEQCSKVAVHLRGR
jgi:hypothetical protein